MTLKSTMEPIQEKYGLDNDNLLIVTYISLLCLNTKFGETIRAVEIVNSSEPADLLLQANLKKLNAFALMTYENNKFQRQNSVNQSYRLFKEARQLFEKVNGKRNPDNDSNMGVALCNFGMALLIKKNPYNFVHSGRSEDQCLELVVDLLIEASQIYKNRQHYCGAAECLRNLSNTLKKLQKPHLYLRNQIMEMSRQIKTHQMQRTDSDTTIHAPAYCIVRHENWDVSLLTEIIDTAQLQAIPSSATLAKNSMGARPKVNERRPAMSCKTNNLRVPVS